jgi:hypothetical protein
MPQEINGHDASWLKKMLLGWHNWFTNVHQPQEQILRKKNAELDAQLKKERATTQALQKTVTSQRKQLQSEIETVRHQFYSATQKKDEFEKTGRKLGVELEQLKKQNNSLSAELQEERLFTKQLQTEMRIQEAVVTKAQVAAVARLTENVSSELSDDIIHQSFKELFEETEEWARQNSSKSFQDRYLVKDDLTRMGMLASDSELAHFDRFDIETDTASDTLLEAVLNKELCLSFLQNPYFATTSIVMDDEQKAKGLMPSILQQVERYLAIRESKPGFTHLPLLISLTR